MINKLTTASILGVYVVSIIQLGVANTLLASGVIGVLLLPYLLYKGGKV